MFFYFSVGANACDNAWLTHKCYASMEPDVSSSSTFWKTNYHIGEGGDLRQTASLKYLNLPVNIVYYNSQL